MLFCFSSCKSTDNTTDTKSQKTSDISSSETPEQNGDTTEIISESEITEDEDLVVINGLNITIKNDGTGSDDNNNGLTKKSCFN